jgi:lipoyltransferase 1
MMWQNSPCVVIGRHQNPWVEANIPYLRDNNINLARRNSGGGAVYHDLGNLNLTFVTTKQKYNRRKNLEFICEALSSVGINTEINDRDDILLHGKKISGTAAKLTRDKSYHHCTLLVHADRTNLSKALKNPHTDIIQTNATKSVRSPVDNLLSASSDITIDKVESALAQCFKPDNTVEHIDDDFVSSSKNEFLSYDWIFGKSPKFSVQENIQIDENNTINVEISVVKGHIVSITLDEKPIDFVIRSDMTFESRTFLDIVQRLRSTEKQVMLSLLRKLNLFV